MELSKQHAPLETPINKGVFKGGGTLCYFSKSFGRIFVFLGNSGQCSIHPIDVIEQKVLYANVEDASFIVPADDVVSHDHNLYERVVDFRERVCFLLPLALFRYRQG